MGPKGAMERPEQPMPEPPPTESKDMRCQIR
jgi:hypothetical protein